MVEMFCVREVILIVEKNKQTCKQSPWVISNRKIFCNIYSNTYNTYKIRIVCYTGKKKSLRTIQPAVNKNFVKLPRSEKPKAIR